MIVKYYMVFIYTNPKSLVLPHVNYAFINVIKYITLRYNKGFEFKIETPKDYL